MIRRERRPASLALLLPRGAHGGEIFSSSPTLPLKMSHTERPQLRPRPAQPGQATLPAQAREGPPVYPGWPGPPEASSSSPSGPQSPTVLAEAAQGVSQTQEYS